MLQSNTTHTPASRARSPIPPCFSNVIIHNRMLLLSRSCNTHTHACLRVSSSVLILKACGQHSREVPSTLELYSKRIDIGSVRDNTATITGRTVCAEAPTHPAGMRTPTQDQPRPQITFQQSVPRDWVAAGVLGGRDMSRGSVQIISLRVSEGNE